jgi:hypothetical protein
MPRRAAAARRRQRIARLASRGEQASFEAAWMFAIARVR